MTSEVGDWRGRWLRIVDAIRIIASPQEEQALLSELATAETARTLGFVNAHGMNSITRHDEFFDALAAADILLRDGSGMSMLYRRRGRPAGLNMNGSDLIPKILAAFRGKRVALWGTEEPWLRAAAAACEERFGLLVVSRENGFHDVDVYRRLASETRLDLIVLGMGMPKQERVARAIRSSAGSASLIVCGGAIIDFLGGRVPRAPQWMRAVGLEWTYRLLREPGRLFKRYVIGNPLFLFRAWRVSGR